MSNLKPGLSKPTLHLNRTYLTEGDMVTATCLAPGETGVFGFYFYDDSVELGDVQTDSNRAQSTLHFTTLGLHRLHCFYTVDNMPVDVKSEESNEVIVTVRGSLGFVVSHLYRVDPNSKPFFFFFLHLQGFPSNQFWRFPQRTTSMKEIL